MFFKKLFAVVIMAAGFAAVALADGQTNQNTKHFVLQSSAFAEGKSIPKVYTCDGKKISPPLSWQGIPDKTKSLVLLVEDPDAPGGLWNHWVVYNIPPEVKNLLENVSADTSHMFGRNSWGEIGYGAPCPPRAEHHYVFKLYALDQMLNLPKKPPYNTVKNAMKGHILAVTTLSGTYKR